VLAKKMTTIFPLNKNCNGESTKHLWLDIAKEIFPHLIGDPQIWCHVGNSLANNVVTSVDGGVHGIWMEADHQDGVSASSDKTLVCPNTSNVACRIVNDSR
jgi:hypothetical protein